MAEPIPELIAYENIPLVWPVIEPRLASAMKKMEFVEYDLPSVYDLLCQARAQLWIGGTGEMVAITRIGTFPNGIRRLIIDFIEGVNYENYKEHMNYIEHWATTQGATQAEAEIRPGLWKVSKEEGWERHRIKVFKRLKQGLH